RHFRGFHFETLTNDIDQALLRLRNISIGLNDAHQVNDDDDLLFLGEFGVDFAAERANAFRVAAVFLGVSDFIEIRHIALYGVRTQVFIEKGSDQLALLAGDIALLRYNGKQPQYGP